MPLEGEKYAKTGNAGYPFAPLACEAPLKAGHPISQWTGRKIADEVKKQGIVEQISPRHASYLREIWGLQHRRACTTTPIMWFFTTHRNMLPG